MHGSYGIYDLTIYIYTYRGYTCIYVHTYTYVCILPPPFLFGCPKARFPKNLRSWLHGTGSATHFQQLKQLVDVEVFDPASDGWDFGCWWSQVWDTSICMYIHIYTHKFLYTRLYLLRPNWSFFPIWKDTCFSNKESGEHNPVWMNSTQFQLQKLLAEAVKLWTRSFTIWYGLSHHGISGWVLGIPSDGRIWCPSKTYGGFLKEHHENFPKWQKRDQQNQVGQTLTKNPVVKHVVFVHSQGL